jgi:formamidopyrimidine-DNA glycosylase
VVQGEAALAAMDPGGIDVLSSTLDAFRAALTAENRTLKRALTDPRIVSGPVVAHCVGSQVVAGRMGAPP